MRWALRSLLALVVLWATYFLSPYWALYSFAKAVEAKDVAAIEERVNFRAVRASLTKQLVTAYLIATGRESELKGTKRQTVAGLAATIADPLVAQYLSPEALAGFLDDPRMATTGPKPLSRAGIGMGSLRDAWRLFLTSETRGFRAISFSLPVDRPADEQFGLQMRLSGLTWRLVGVEVPKPVLQRLLQELMKSNPTGS